MADVPSKETLITLKQAYLKIGNDFKAAETLELQNELYPNVENLNSIGVLYHNSGNNERLQNSLNKLFSKIRIMSMHISI